MRIRVKFYTGPRDVEHYAARVSDSARAIWVFEGTEHIYFTVEGSSLIDGRIVAEQILNTTLNAFSNITVSRED